MLYVPLDANWPDNPKVIEAGLEGAGLHAVAMCVAKRLDTDGWVDRRLLHRQGASDELIDRLVDLGLLDADGRKVRPHDWLSRNPSQAAIAARRASKVRASKAGNHKRHGHAGDVDECPICWPPEPQNPSVLAPAIAEPRTPLADDLRSDRPYPESESYPEPASASDPATTPELRQARLAAAAEIIGERAARKPSAGDPEAVRRGVANTIKRNRHADAYRLIAAEPTITPEELAERLEPTPPAKPEPVNTSAHLRPVAEVLPEWQKPTDEERAEVLTMIRSHPLRRTPDGAA